jgi:anti-sigma factor RsiW
VTCASVRERLAAYVDGELDAATHGAVRDHAAACAACREALVEADPLMIFADLSAQTRPAAAWDGFWEGIQAALPEAARAPARRSAAPRLRATAVLAAAAALLILVAAYVLTARTPSGEAPPAVVALARPELPAGMPLPQTVEQVNTPGERPVQVFSMAYGADSGVPASEPGQVTELVLIVDAGLEL